MEREYKGKYVFENTDKDVIAGTEYIYTVRAVNGNSVGYFDKNGISSKNTETVE